MAQILIAASDVALSRQLVELLGARGHAVEVASELDAALGQVEQVPPELCVLELVRDDAQANECLERLRRAAPSTAFVVVAEEGAVDVVVQAVKRGADQGLCRPLTAVALDGAVKQALERGAAMRDAPLSTPPATGRERGEFQRLVAAHPLMQQLLAKAYQAAQSRATVLIHGETGTGKELVAAAIHQNSKRRTGPFIRLNCAALSETLLESELFGHERGAFTGAVGRRKGRFEQAHQGTLFLDEVSEIPLSVQVKLLRFLQEREFERVGGDEPLQVDVRIVAATNRDLKAMVDEHTFREDLYYRLNVVRLEVPPLRARSSDVPLLAEHFLHRYAAENEKEVSGMSDAARDALVAHSWPGNVRELQNVIEQAVVLSESAEIGIEALPLAGELKACEPVRLMIPGVTLAELERFAIERTLDSVGGSPSKAASILGISRRTIQYRMREWGMSPREKLDDDDEAEADAN
ncbi:MAG: sigma-54-dependent Fis family transcriptional regulator [Deltaproteobacteria bacterium]|nr:sigma-54-dependent Fis family transcriptional regulator [Deltaproteobacteria bacterium]